MSKRLRALLLDLDNTLWDFDANANRALEELFYRHHLQVRTGKTVDYFIAEYKEINKSYWEKYEKGEISKDFLRTRRFTDVFIKLGISEEDHPENLWEEYLEICPKMTLLIDGAIDFLDFFKGKTEMAVITNGFENTQRIKIKEAGLENYLKFMITSEEAGCAKPDHRIFERALDKGGWNREEVLYVGDTFRSDIVGAINAGIACVLFDRSGSERKFVNEFYKPLYVSDSLESIRSYIAENRVFSE